MEIVFNGQEVAVAPDTCLKKFLEDQGFTSQGVAVACDDEIVPKSKWDEFLLKDGIKLDVFNLVAGG